MLLNTGISTYFNKHLRMPAKYRPIKNKALKGKELIRTLSDISGYPAYEVKDILYYLAVLMELKLAANEPVFLHGIGLFHRMPAKKYKKIVGRIKHPVTGKIIDAKGTDREGEITAAYRKSTVAYYPDRVMLRAMNETPNADFIDWSKVDQERIFEMFRMFYIAKYGENFKEVQDRRNSAMAGEARVPDLEKFDKLLEKMDREDEFLYNIGTAPDEAVRKQDVSIYSKEDLNNLRKYVKLMEEEDKKRKEKEEEFLKGKESQEVEDLDS